MRAPTMSSSAASKGSWSTKLSAEKAKVAYVMGFAGTSPQILRAKGWDEFRAQHPQYEEVVRSTDDLTRPKRSRWCRIF